MIVFVGDDDPVLRVAEDAGGSVELSGKVSGSSEFVMEHSLRGEHLDSIVGPVGNLKKIGINWLIRLLQWLGIVWWYLIIDNSGENARVR